MKIWFAAIMLLLAAPVAAQAQVQDISAPGTVPHVAARAGFPEQVGPFRRVHVLRYGENDLSANYDLRRDGEMVRLSVYIYPAPRVAQAGRATACREEMEGVHAAILRNNDGARRIETGEAPALPDTEAGSRLRSLHSVPMTRDGKLEDVRRDSRLYCYVGGDWFVKFYTSSSPGVPADEVDAAIDAFIRSGPWPGRGAGAIALR